MNQRYGFIGYGHMGSAIIDAFLKRGLVPPSHISISTRSTNKLKSLKNTYPDLTISSDNTAVGAASDILFICVRTPDVKTILEEIASTLKPSTHLVLINAALQMRHVTNLVSCMVSRALPTQILSVGKGVTLMCHDASVDEASAKHLQSLFENIGVVRLLPETHFDRGTDLTSCGPAFIASIFEQCIKAGVRKSDLTEEDVTDMVIETLYGTAKLLRQRNLSIQELKESIATKGGITEMGVRVLEQDLPSVFDRLFKTTDHRYSEISSRLDADYAI